MANWNEIRTDVSKAAKDAVKKTGEFAENASIHLNIKRVELRLHAAFERLGRLTYKQLKADESQAELISETIATIDSLRTEMSEYKKKLDDAKKEKEESKDTVQ